MKLHDALYTRRSVRHFTDEQIDPATLTEIIHDAQRAPSWANSQPWHVVIATGNTLTTIKQQHRKLAQAGRGGNAELDVMHRNDWSTFAQNNMRDWNQQVMQTLAADPAGRSTFLYAQQNLFDAAAIVYLLLPTNTTGWSLYDLGAFGQTLMLSATDHNVQSIPAYELVRYPDLLHQQLNIPHSEMFAMGIALGHAADTQLNTLITDRVKTSDVLTILD